MKIYSDGTYQSPLFVNSNPVGGGVPAFVFEIKTTAPGETFTLPLELSGTYDFNWKTDDGQSEDITAYNQAEITRTFASAGTYICTITGRLWGWRFNLAGDRLKIYDISSWGNGVFRLGNSGSYFYGCINLTVSATDILDLFGVISLTSAFDLCAILTNIPSINGWDFANIESLYRIFRNTDMDQSFIFNSSSATDMTAFLVNASNYDQDLSGIDISSMTTAASMLAGTTLSTTNLSNTYIGWAAQPHQNNVTAGMGNGTYNAAGEVAKNILLADGWIITDGGLAP